MEQFFEALKRHIEEHPLNFGDSNSVLTMLYECYSENYPYDNEQIRSGFSELYKQMNGMPLQEVDKIVYPVCTLCRDHERSGFAHGVQVGIMLFHEIMNNKL